MKTNQTKKKAAVHARQISDESVSEYLRPAAAAEYLGATVSTLAKWRLLGKGPAFHKLGTKLVTYRRGDLDDWLASRRVNSTSETVEAA